MSETGNRPPNKAGGTAAEPKVLYEWKDRRVFIRFPGDAPCIQVKGVDGEWRHEMASYVNAAEIARLAREKAELERIVQTLKDWRDQEGDRQEAREAALRELVEAATTMLAAAEGVEAFHNDYDFRHYGYGQGVKDRNVSAIPILRAALARLTAQEERGE